MPEFAYTVRDKAGKVTKGTLEAESKQAVQAKLAQMGYIIVDLKAAGALSAAKSISFGSGVKPKDVTIFARQFSTMVNAGLSLTKCLTILSQQTENKYLRDIIADLYKSVEAGSSLSEAMAKHKKVFPPIFINMIRAGETGGVLDEVLNRVADFFEKDMALRQKIKSAMSYPISMGVLVLIVLAAMMIFVVPTFQKMFEDMGGELPFITQALVNTSEFVSGVGGIVSLLGTVVFVIVFKWWSKGPGKYVWDGMKLNMPVFGGLTRKGALAKFTRTFGTLIQAGVPILAAMDIVADTSGNEVVTRELKRAREAIKEGETIAKPLSESKVFPAMLVQMISVGEETGALDQMLNKVADFYDEEVSAAVDGLTSMIEPLMMASLGGVVGVIVVALYMPMFQVITLVQ